eukprot:Nitzschia sp. Nitz4//scaffold41_size133979//117900//120962//NITZ4_003371-RA/size133979-processed-gene-0.93-mRNA-1//-1//CDS//3329551542//8145//frame0
MTPRMAASSSLPKKLPARGRKESTAEEASSNSMGDASISTDNNKDAKKSAKSPSKATPQTQTSSAGPTRRSSRKKSEDTTVDQSSTTSSAQEKELAKVATSSALHVPGRRPMRKRKGSVDFTIASFGPDETDTKPTISSADALPSMDALAGLDDDTPMRIRSLSIASGLISGSGASLEQLDALGEEAMLAASRIKSDSIDLTGVSSRRKGSIGSRTSGGSHDGTYTSQSHRFLMQAFMGDGSESLVDSKAAEEAETFELKRERLGSFDVQRDRMGSFDVSALGVRNRIGSFDGRRERLESWGGMSDLSIPVHDNNAVDSLIGNGGGPSAAALAATLCSTLANDLTAAGKKDGDESVSNFLVGDDKIPSKISLNRNRLDSVASATSDTSLSQFQLDVEIPSDIQKFVKAAMASVGDQLAEIAVAATDAVKDNEENSELSSTASPLIGASLDINSVTGGRSRAFSMTGSGIDLAVDYDAVAAAINAAEAATGAIDLAAFAQSASDSSVATAKMSKRKRPPLPTKPASTSLDKKGSAKRSALELPPIPTSKMDERDMELIRERARAAAGYIPPSSADKLQQPPRKRPKTELPPTPGAKPSAVYSTPKTAMTNSKSVASTPYTPAMSTPGSMRTPASKGQSSQKWDSMFDCLLEFIEERRVEETTGLSDEEKKDWIWDGNVPTTFKTKDGKALGRWVNNQRSAKSKGVLKEDREERLVNAGLKWSVLASNCWNVMLDELRLYVAENTKAGRKWDGNVPTNYQVKTKAGAAAKDDEDKNLGRWVNRQRSLYQAGKLRHDRQKALEKVGLKWSMLATTSWDSMFETLCEYVTSKTKDGASWDGNVPANYRTTDDPPRALGRWINRQRSAYGKNRLKEEYIQKLNEIGLKWCVHERRPTTPNTPRSAVLPDNVSSGAANDLNQSTVAATSEASNDDVFGGENASQGDDQDDPDDLDDEANGVSNEALKSEPDDTGKGGENAA